MAAELSLCNSYEPNDLQLVEKCPKQELQKLIHGFLDVVCGLDVIKFHDYSKIWSALEWQLLTKSWTSCLRSFVRNNLSTEKVHEQLEQCSISKEVKKMVIECLWPRRHEIRQSFIDETCELSHATLKDFDWKLKLIMATDKLANMREPVVSLDLDLEGRPGKKEVSVELSKEELKELISSLEAANKIVMQLKG